MSQNQKMEEWDFIVVGAGICGLSLASLLANDGYKVLVLEKSQNIGGRAQVVEKDGFILDYGIHTVRFGEKSTLAKTLETIRTPEQEPIIFKQLGMSYYYLEKTEIEEEKKKTLPRWEIFPIGISGITKGSYFKLKRLLRFLWKFILSKSKKNLDISVEKWAESKKLTEVQFKFLKLITSSMQVCPFLDRASIGELKRNLMEVLKKRLSATYPIGGWKIIFERLISKIESSESKIITNTEVKEIVIEKKENMNVAVGVKTDGEQLTAKNVIIGIPVQQIKNILDVQLIDSETFDLYDNLRPTSGISIDFCLNIVIADGDGLYFFEDPVGFGYFTSNLDESAAPQGKQILTMFFPCDYGDLDNEKFRKENLQIIRNKLSKAFPDLKESIEFERPLFLKMVDGAEVNTKQYTELRPRFTVPGINNLYLVGDSTAGEGAGGDIGHNSVWETYHEIKKGY
jgi:phytoene dehydrogenase-like protein